MAIQRWLVALTVVNVGSLVLLALWHVGPAGATAAVPVLRGRALEIVDAQGRVRASIQVQPAGTVAATGQRYPETVILRLIDPHGRPEVKLVGSEQGAGLSLVGETDRTHVVLKADGSDSSLTLTSKDGRQQSIKP